MPAELRNQRCQKEKNISAAAAIAPPPGLTTTANPISITPNSVGRHHEEEQDRLAAGAIDY